MTFEQKQWAAVFVGFACIEVALLYELIASGDQTSQIGLITAICIIGILFMLSPKLDSLESLSYGKEGFRAELVVLQKKTDKNEQVLTRFILLSMGPETYINLQYLATGEYGKYEKEPHMGLETELYHLRNHGYIALKEGSARSIHEIPEKGDQLSDYIEVTEEGRKFLELRNNIQNIESR